MDLEEIAQENSKLAPIFAQENILKQNSRIAHEYAKDLLKYPFEDSEQAFKAFEKILKPEKLSDFVSKLKFYQEQEIPLEAPFTIRAVRVDKNVVAKAEESKLSAQNDFESDSSTGEDSDERVFDGNILIENQDLWIKNKKIIEDASFTIVRGRIYGLVGKNGIGKSTLLKAIRKRKFNISKGLHMYLVKQEENVQDLKVLDYILDSCYDDYDTIIDAKKILSEIGFSIDSPEEKNNSLNQSSSIADLSQESDNALLDQKLCSLTLSKSNYKKHTSIKSNEKGVNVSIYENIKNLSGGWCVRASLAKAILKSPELLLLDEPTNMLDFPTIVWLENAIKKLNTTAIIVSHDREFLNNVCTDIFHLVDMKIFSYKGNYDSFVHHRKLMLENQQKEHEKQVEYRRHLQDFIDRFRYNSKRASLAQSKIKILENMKIIEPVKKEAQIKFTFRSSQVRGSLIEFKSAFFAYQNKSILEKIDFKILNTSRIVIVGPNGAGKSTFLRLISKKLEVSTGTAIYNPNIKPGYFTQHHIDQLTLNESVLEFFHRKTKMKDDEMRKIMSQFNLVADIQKIGTLSGGQKSRLAFSILSATEPNMLILDEPTNHLDIESIDALAECLKDFKGAVIAVSHDLKFIESIFDEVWVCEEKGLTRFNGTIRDYKNHLLNNK